MENDTLTAIEGLRVGHASLEDAPSGCTVVLPENGATAGVDVRGGAPGVYGTETINPVNLIDRVHGIFLTGGSAYGMSVSEGVRNYLRHGGVGFDTGHGAIPIIVGAVIFDLGVNPGESHPDAVLGYEACVNASRGTVAEGCVGAGSGATVGKLYGVRRGMKSGLGSACIHAPNGAVVAALVVVNAFGDICDPALNQLIAGCRKSVDSMELINSDAELRRLKQLRGFPNNQHAVIGVVATNVKLDKTQLTKVAQMAHDGLARTVYPAHTAYDGDTIFALSCGGADGIEVSVVGALAAQVTAMAILRAVRKARRLGQLPAACEVAGLAL